MGVTTSMTRRGMLGLSGAAAATALVGCGGGGGSGSGKVTLATAIEKGQFDSDAYYHQWLPKFTEQTGIEVEFRSYPFDQYGNSIQLLFSQGSPPDVFRSAGTTIHMPVPYVRGWLHPLNDYVSGEYKSRWPEGSFDPKISGLHIGDDLYGLPKGANGAVYPLYSNSELLKKYGVSQPPTTWSELADVAEKVTKDSNGEVAGFYPLASYHTQALQATAGPDIGLGPASMSLLTGKSAASADNQLAMIELLRRMGKAGTFIKGWQSEQAQKSQEMWKAMAQNKVAMAFGSNWYYREMLRLRKDLPLEMSPAPVPDDGRKGCRGQQFVFLPYWHMGSKTQIPDSAGKLLAFLTSAEVVLAYYKLSRRNPPALPLSEFGDLMDKWDKRMFEVKGEAMKYGPAAPMHSVDASTVEGAIGQGEPKPTLQELRTLALTRLDKYDYRAEATAYDQKNEQNIDKQLGKAKSDGKDVSRQTFTFSDWDPTKSYLPPGVEKMPDLGYE